MKKQILRTLCLICLCMNTAADAVDIKTVFLKIKHPLFIESIRPFIHSNFYEPKGKKAPISQADIDNIFENYVNHGILDLKNHYIHFEKDGAMGIYIREYVLYFSEEKLPIFVGSEQNSSLHEKFTNIFALCQQRNLSWTDCTSEVFPKFTVADFLRDGQKLSPKTADLFSIRYKLPRKGTDIELEIVSDALTFDNLPEWGSLEAAEKAFKAEMDKFTKQNG